MKQYYVYILFNQSRTLYTGITSDLESRLYRHRNKLLPGFTGRYNITQLAYYEIFGDAMLAIEREKQIKGWKREKKIALIEFMNSRWEDLTNSLAEVEPFAEGDVSASDSISISSQEVAKQSIV